MDALFKDLNTRFEEAFTSLQKDLAKVRTGRANLSILDSVKVDYYGTLTPLNQVAQLNVADARMITIKPWEKNLLTVIEKTLVTSQLGLTPNNDGEIIRLTIPPLTEERRKDLVKQVKKRAEESKVAIRGFRRDINDRVGAMEKTKQITEDDKRKGQKRCQDDTDKAIEKVDEMVAKKEKELMDS